jgi:hypothetical protein
MATWQYDLFLVPRQAVSTRYAGVPDRISREDFDSVSWWQGIPFSPAWESSFAFLPRREVWSNSILGWGTEDGNRVDILLEDDDIAEVHVRLDAREPDLVVVRHLARVAEQQDLLVLTQDLRLRQPRFDQLLLDFIRSPAARFASDPVGFLASVRPFLRLEDP